LTFLLCLKFCPEVKTSNRAERSKFQKEQRSKLQTQQRGQNFKQSRKVKTSKRAERSKLWPLCSVWSFDLSALFEVLTSNRAEREKKLK
jgi:hypothetical protein